MRLTNVQRETIKGVTKELFGSDAEVKLFGSRLDDAAKGGDIDLLVVSEALIKNKVQKALYMVARLQVKLGDQPIDVLVVDPETALTAVHRQALRAGETL
ncbi:nucleotidyltransferase domain-containing protein [Halomonas llamarensis]|uniref:Nucleotidyltransferase domain-containing protein n=1 Tax=Halomonas llamarensis TaxID=2945104 RepID=A0ABT0SPT3_9GAMM|nr:nucleotidyltransferase domain-containing protein [Halomonas llamarensis]MCL7929746.1 nucleotidyltransferase domain-containing protein [Halomonas llamarensis]